jgi:hypothetical protein
LLPTLINGALALQDCPTTRSRAVSTQGAIFERCFSSGGDMNAKLYLTIFAVVAILYGIGFVLIPQSLAVLYGVPPDPYVILNARFFGSALLALGVIAWFGRDFGDWSAVRGVLIGAAVGDVVGGLINIWATIQGLLNALAWSSTILYALLLVGALYCLSAGSKSQST